MRAQLVITLEFRYPHQGWIKKNMSLLQDERLVLYVPRNYNELSEYFNDTGERFMESKNDVETKSIRRQQMQNKYSYIKQQQNCYHLFDAEFQDFKSNKVRKYYSKALLKEALESHDAKLLQQVRQWKIKLNFRLQLMDRQCGCWRQQ
ncbi:unnamed protein product [Paramecium octaurelia]|uniref:Uncharacterized protein n=1 Tax=Paramecium octaurelia TaxID=43137 RepID=A0A8S1V7F8_PAROT|nr:unnamed protein product [Paramecium octaurelia]